MNRLLNYTVPMAFFVAIFMIPLFVLGEIEMMRRAFWFAIAIGFYEGLAQDGIKLVWQTPTIFYHAGLYLKVRDKRYRLIRVGPR